MVSNFAVKEDDGEQKVAVKEDDGELKVAADTKISIRYGYQT